jgi:hypothetical protein
LGRSQAVVASVAHKFSDITSATFAYAGNYEKDKQNQAVNTSVSVRRGAWTSYVGAQFSDDQVRKSGSRLNFGTFMEAGGRQAYAEYVQVSPDFFPRLGFSPERDFRGLAAGYERELQFTSGSLTDLIFGVSGASFVRFNGDDYRRSLSGFVYAPFRRNFALSASAESSTFERSHDHSASIAISYPRNNPYRGLSLGATSGRFGGLFYRNLSIDGRYKMSKRWDVSLSAQSVRLGETTNQLILSTNFDIRRDQAAGARLVAEDGDLNWYLSYRLSGRRGNELFLIIGDPNSRTFLNQIVLKAVVPVTIRY